MEGRSFKQPKIKNKNAADIQISAEQILREANERQEGIPKAPKQKITDLDELNDYKLRKRSEFENSVRKNRLNIGSWIRYAQWEESQMELARARNVFIRALEVDSRNVTVRLKYIEMEIKNRNVNLARNLLDNCTTILPRVDQFWFKYVHMEEMLDNVHGTRGIFERWMKWEPDEAAWNAYIKLEIRYGEIERARNVFHRFVECHPHTKNFIKWVKFEEEHNNFDKAREIYSGAIEFFGDAMIDPKIFLSFAKFESRMKQYERARVLFKYALERVPKSKAEVLYQEYILFEKRFGDKDGIESLVINRRRNQYEEELKHQPHHYDVWFDFIRLEEENGDPDKVREVYERAVAQVPPTEAKRFWRRYIYLWINYALYEELTMKDIPRTRAVYLQCLQLIPHTKFTFAKVWVWYAKFELRQGEVQKARKALGQALGRHPKPKLFKSYIDLEIQLREFDRVRTLHAKFLEFQPSNVHAWIQMAELENGLGDVDRARAVFHLASTMPTLDMPEVLWKAYIDFEIEQKEFEKARSLYELLLEKTNHVKVWISYAQFELSVPTDTPVDEQETKEQEEDVAENVLKARIVFSRAYQEFQLKEMKQERFLLLEAWKDFEKVHGTSASFSLVDQKTPVVEKKRKRLEDGTYQELLEYSFPDDDQSSSIKHKLLSMARLHQQSKLKDSE